jgi:hypothetical protein
MDVRFMLRPFYPRRKIGGWIVFKAVWTLWSGEKFLTTARIPTPASQPIDILIELARLFTLNTPVAE